MAGTGRGMMAISLAGIVVLVVVGVLLAQVGLELNATTIGGLGGSLVVLFVVGWRSRQIGRAHV